MPYFPTSAWTAYDAAGLVVFVVGVHLGVSRSPATSMLHVVGFKVRSILKTGKRRDNTTESAGFFFFMDNYNKP